MVLITTGRRPKSLRESLRSLKKLEPVPDEVVIVWNGSEPETLDSEIPIVHVHNHQNLGIPAARNQGVEVATGEVVVFLDDDATLESPHTIEILKQEFGGDPALGAVGFKVVDPESGLPLRRWLPRPRRSIASGGPVSRFPGGAAAVRISAFGEVGGLPDAFFYSHEETDLAWRLIDSGFGITFEPRIVVHHPASDAKRHPDAIRIGCRNRVWLAKRRLPILLGIIYVSVWSVLSLLRSRNLADLQATFRGFADGLRQNAGDRQSMRWNTVWRLARLGHVPIF